MRCEICPESARKEARVPTIAPERHDVVTNPGFPGFVELADCVGLRLERFQKRIVKAVFDGRRELLTLLPRGAGKTCLQALVALHHLLTREDAEIYCAASSRDQARLLHSYAVKFARELDDPHVVHRHLELRWCPDPDEPKVFTRFLRVLPAEAPRLFGLTPSLMILDELQALDTEDVYIALSSALHKRPDSKLIVVSTAGQGATSPLGRLRRRALALPDVKRKGFLTEATGPDFAMLEWAAPEEEPITPSVVKKANPQNWVTTAQIAQAKEALPELAYRRFVANQWTARTGSWLPAGAWQNSADGKPIAEGSKVWLGADLGGARSDTALLWLARRGDDDHFDLGCRIWSGESALMDATAFVPTLAQRYRIVEFVFDPWRAQTLAHIAEQHRIRTTVFPQHDARMIPASAALHQAITEGRIHHPDDEKLNEHVAAAVARSGRRGWRIDQAERGTPVDGVIALCMAFESATQPPPPETKVLGWL
jgi:phage terminase large subunit-like protein